MRWFYSCALLGLLGLAATSRAGCPLGGCCPSCQPIPCTCCQLPNTCPCENRLHMNVFDDAQKYIDLLHAGCGCADGASCECGGSTCCERIKAAEKLGSRLHADFCCCPEVVDALLGALSCDKCWEVRYAAAWSLFKQDARTDQVVMALYISSKMDPHYMVRTRAAEALDILTVCRKDCYKDLYKSTDDLIKELKKQGYKPGTDKCGLTFGAAWAACGGVQTLAPAVPVIAPAAPGEPLKTMPKEKPEASAAPAPTDLPAQPAPAVVK